MNSRMDLSFLKSGLGGNGLIPKPPPHSYPLNELILQGFIVIHRRNNLATITLDICR